MSSPFQYGNWAGSCYTETYKYCLCFQLKSYNIELSFYHMTEKSTGESLVSSKLNLAFSSSKERDCEFLKIQTLIRDNQIQSLEDYHTSSSQE